MSVYLKEFENHTQYENYINGSGAILPNVSICTTEGDVHYKPYVDPYAGHDYVEIRGRKWATMNIGANSVTDTGLYFQWGDTQGYTAAQVGSGSDKKYFGWADYKYNSGGTEPTDADMVKYNSTDGKTVLETADDAAQTNWGGKWRMPTTDEFMALGEATNYEWVENYQGTGVSGVVLTDKTDSSKVLFFPSCGYCKNGSIKGINNGGNYWYSFLDTNSRDRAVGFAFYNIFIGERKEFIADWKNNYYRYYGYTVRPVAAL